jgi:hypothetical protein
VRARRLIGLGVSGGFHAAVVVLLVLRAQDDRLLAPAAVVIEQVSPEALAPPPDRQLPASTEDALPLWEASMLRVEEFTFDIAKIREQLNVLFPFLTLDLGFLDRVPEDVRAARDRLSYPHGADAGGRSGSGADELGLTDPALQQLTDRAWSRRERWKHFAEIVKLTAIHHPDRGRLPEVVRTYLDQNILQPYCDGDKHDPRFWAMLENAADHADFIDFIRSYARRYPSSKTTTELLFLLDELAQGSRDVILMVIQTRPDEHLQFTRTTSPQAYDLAVAAKERYGRWLMERGMDKVTVRRRYNELRLHLLRTIIETTPQNYRAADAKFLAGQVLWEMSRVGDAERIWRSIAVVDGDAYHRVYTELLDELSADPPLARAIDRILGAEYGRWRIFSIDRLRQFGHHCDTF